MTAELTKSRGILAEFWLEEFKQAGGTAETIRVSTTMQCPACGAAVRPDAAWCTLCYTSLRPDFDPLTAPIEEVMGTLDTDTLTAPAPAPAPVAEPAVEPPRTTASWVDESVSVPQQFAERSSPQEPTDEPAEISDIDVMLGMLAAEHRQSERATELASQLDDKGTRTMVMIGGTVLIAVGLFVLMVVAGLFA